MSKKNFKLIRQTLFDKIGNCFMFLKLNNLYDNFNLKNLLLILKSRKLNEKLGEISHMPKQKIRKTVIDASPPKNGVLSDFKPRRLKKK